MPTAILRMPDASVAREATRANALFVSSLQPSDEPTDKEIAEAVSRVLGTLGVMGCAGRVAEAYGDQQVTAVDRMRWARARVGGTCPQPLSSSEGGE